MLLEQHFITCLILLHQCHHEHFKLAVLDFDVFAGIEGSKIDVKNPLPTRLVLSWVIGYLQVLFV